MHKPAHWSERQCVIHTVCDRRSSALGDERMLMPPQRIWPLELHIQKPPRRLPFQNLRRPLHRNFVHAQSIPDQRSCLDLLGSLENVELEQRRSQLLQIRWPREEFEYRIQRSRNPLRAADCEGFCQGRRTKISFRRFYGKSQGRLSPRRDFATNFARLNRLYSTGDKKKPDLLASQCRHRIHSQCPQSRHHTSKAGHN